MWAAKNQICGKLNLWKFATEKTADSETTVSTFQNVFLCVCVWGGGGGDRGGWINSFKRIGNDNKIKYVVFNYSRPWHPGNISFPDLRFITEDQSC